MADEPQKPGEDEATDFSAISATASPKPQQGLLDRLKRKAEKEQKALEDPKKSAHDEVYRLTIRALRFGAWVLGLLVLVRLWHLAGPYELWETKVRWLTEADINAIDKMLFSGALGGLVLGHLKEIMKPISKD